jgi:hypothetical protein
MKLIKLLIITASIFMMNKTYAVQYKFVAMDNSIDTKICVLAGSNEVKALKKVLIRLSRVSAGGVLRGKRYIVNGIHCNEQILANFSKKYQANLTYSYLKKYTDKRYLNQETEVIIRDIADISNDNRTEDKVILVHVGH